MKNLNTINQKTKLIQKAELILEELIKLYPEPRCELNFTQDYELLFAVIMSAQTTDVQVNILTSRLFQKYKSLDDFAEANLSELAQDMASIGLFRVKAKYIKTAANLLINTYNRKIPTTIQELITIPGVARKTANVVLHELYGIQEGIAVDTHVSRLSRQLGLTKHTNPLQIEKDLISIIPQPQWGKFSLRLILYGRYYWPARSKSHTGTLAKFAVESDLNPKKTKEKEKINKSQRKQKK